MKIKPPCKENGIPCANRCVGCHSSCDKYKAYRAEIDSINEIKAANRMAADCACEAIFRNRRILSHTINGRKALAQR